MLTATRILDLTGQLGEVGPHLLADLGAEVIKVVPVDDGDGDGSSRAVDDLEYHAYNANKELIGFSGDDQADRGLLAQLLGTCDIVFESGPPGRLAELGITRDELVALNPTIVQVVISPFGLDGPRAAQPATELTVAALGGPVRLQGTRDRAPVHFSIPQTWRHAGAEAAGAALVALQRRDLSGEPQFVDVSAQAVMTWTMLNAMEAHSIQGREFERDGSTLNLSIPVQLRLDASDGYVIGVPTARLAQPLLPWLVAEGIVPETWLEVDWATFDHRAISGEPVEPTMAEVGLAIAELCRRSPKAELFARGLRYGATLAPLNDVVDLLAFDHLVIRSFWTEPDPDSGHERLNAIRWPGAPWVIDGVRPVAVRGRATVPGPAPAQPEQGNAPDDGGGWWRQARSAVDPGPIPCPGADEAPQVSRSDGGRLPFDGLKVLDLSWIGVGPITAKALADHGATVVRVESESRLDGLRRQPPYLDDEAGINRSHFFGTFNTSKYSLGLDLKTEAGRALALRLATWADVVIESFTPGTIDRLGLGFEALSAANPSLVMVSTSLLASGSDVSCMAGYGYHAAAIAGFQDLVGWPDLPPDGPWLAYTDTIGPRFIVPALLAALRHRAHTGRGCHIEASQLEIALQLLSPELARHQLDGSVPPRRGNRDPRYAPQGIYPTAGDDRWVAISVPDDDSWQRLLGVVGPHPDWLDEPALATAEGRHRVHDAIDEWLAGWSAGLDGPRLEQLLSEAGVPAGVAQSSEDLAADPQYRHRDFYHHHEHSEVGTVPHAGHQYRIGGYEHGPRWAAPCLGEHTWEVLTDLLGMSDDEAAELAAADVLG